MHISLSTRNTHCTNSFFPFSFSHENSPFSLTAIPQNTHTHTHFFLHCQLTHIQKHHHTHFVSNTHVTFTVQPSLLYNTKTHTTPHKSLSSPHTLTARSTHTHIHFHLFFLSSLFSLLTYKHSLPTTG